MANSKITDVTIRNLTEEADALGQEVESIKNEMMILERKYTAKLIQQKTILRVINSYSKKSPSQKTSDGIAVSAGKTNFSGMKFRDIVRTVMNGAIEPIRPRDVAKALEKAGVEQPGKSDLSTRVGVELYKLMKAGELVRHDGRYSLVKKQAG